MDISGNPIPEWLACLVFAIGWLLGYLTAKERMPFQRRGLFGNPTQEPS